MKIILAGDFLYSFYQEGVAQAMERSGHEVIRFKFLPFYQSTTGKMEKYFNFIGYHSYRLNQKLLQLAVNENAGIIFIWSGTHIQKGTLKKIKERTGSLLISYNNDDPFGDLYQQGNPYLKNLWKNFRLTIPGYDVNLVYRKANIAEYLQAGAGKVILFLPYYLPEDVRDDRKYEKKLDVVFVGHPTDERVAVLTFLLNNNIRLKVFGTGWDKYRKADPRFAGISRILGDDYRQVLREAKISLAFLSKLNRDTYTRRNFEIPANGSLMLSERTDELALFFEEGKEAEYFQSKEELLNKIAFYLANETKREEIAALGHKRAVQSGYDVQSRVDKMLQEILPE